MLRPVALRKRMTERCSLRDTFNSEVAIFNVDVAARA